MRPTADTPLDSWTGQPCKHDSRDLGRFEPDVCHGCGTDFSEGAPASTPHANGRYSALTNDPTTPEEGT